jgi:Cu/Ag efflux pump CusA
MMTKLPKGYYVEWSGQWENQIVPTNTISDIAYRRTYHIPDFIFYI